jgi:putative Holliday junction resolvase
VGRIVAFDVGERRIGMAISDPTATLARPLDVITIRALESAAVLQAADAVARLVDDDGAIEMIVVGLPRRLDGSPNAMTPRVQAFAADLQTRTGLPVVLQDERLTSREAESRLALREKDWRVRKRHLDAAAAAIILQDYLDTRPACPIPLADDPEC